MTAAHAIAILQVGLVTAVGADAAASAAAIRCKVANPSPTPFMDRTGEWIMAHQVAREGRGPVRLAGMAASAIAQALGGTQRAEWSSIPLLLCVAECGRPGAYGGVELLGHVRKSLGADFGPESAAIEHGRVAVAEALLLARHILHAGRAKRVLVAAVDSLIAWPTLMHFDCADRLLRQDNSNGFMPGEGAGAILVGLPTGEAELLCNGLGFAEEAATLESEEPLRADGLSRALRTAALEAGLQIHEYDLRMADLSGEQYYFKEAALALQRTLRQTKAEFDLWHPAECTGEAGALAGVAIVAVADMACRHRYSPGPRVIAHLSNDDGARAAISLQFGGW